MRQRLSQYLVWVTSVLLAVQVILVCLQVTASGLIPDSFTREVSKYLMTWVALLGVGLAVSREHLLNIRLWRNPPPWWESLSGWTRSIATILLFLVLLGFGAWNVLLNLQDQKVTDALGWPKYWVSAALPVGMAVAIWACLGGMRREDGES